MSSEQDSSPYQKPRPHPHFDFKHEKFLEDTCLQSRKKDRKARLTVALFGLGRAGSIHFRVLRANHAFRLKYIIEPNTERVDLFKESLLTDDVVFLGSGEEDAALNDKEVEAVIIATPTFTHEQLIIRSLKAGKAVFCEKPVSQSEEGTEQCYEVAKECGKPLFCAFNRRFDPAFAEVKDQVQKGHIGKVHIIRTTARDSPLPSIDYLKTSGGFFHDSGVHDIDLVCWVLGEYPIEVSAFGHSFIPEIKALNDCDTIIYTMKFPSGAIASTDLSRNSVYGYDQRLEVYGSKGMLSANNETPYQVVHWQEGVPLATPIYHSFPSRFSEAYALQMDYFYDIVLGTAEVTASAEHVLKVNKIASLLEESAKQHKFMKCDL